jgi:hypothetical protein
MMVSEGKHRVACWAEGCRCQLALRMGISPELELERYARNPGPSESNSDRMAC